MGAEVKTFNPSGLPLPDDALDSHPKVLELRELVRWCDGMIWSSPERHGAMSSVMKAQIDWIPLSEGAVRPSQGKTLAVMQVCGGSQSFPWYDRIVDVAEELFKITLILKEHTSYLADRYSERKENHQALSARVNQAKI